MNPFLTVTLLVFNLATVLLHVVGSVCLMKIYKLRNTQTHRNQQTLIFHLSISLIIISLSSFVRHVSLYVNDTESDTESIERRQYIKIFSHTGTCFVYYMDMLYIIIDRLLSVALDLRYRMYCTKRRLKILLLVTWAIAIGMIVGFGTAHYKFTYDWEGPIYLYIYPTLDAAVVLASVAMYSYIFVEYKRSSERRRAMIQIQGSSSTPLSSFRLFRQSKFFIQILLVGSFTAFVVLPDLVLMYYGALGMEISETVCEYCSISYTISDMTCGLIYIFLQPSVRKLLRNKMRRVDSAVGNNRIAPNQQVPPTVCTRSTTVQLPN